MKSFTKEQNKDELKRSAIIFSPHPDDETLGCGGTIMKKKVAGADIHIVFMTDGGGSHAHLISEDTLISIREREALAATQALGMERNKSIFLGFKDKNLWENHKTAMDKVIQILLHRKPDEIFIPYYRETVKDHWATNKIVISALEKVKNRTIVYEYPVWFWNHWPWVSTSLKSRPHALKILKKSFFSNIHLLFDFRCSVDIHDILELKWAALSEYKSQMTRLIPDHRWATLHDLANGRFLNCFFQSHEIFHRYCLFQRY